MPVAAIIFFAVPLLEMLLLIHVGGMIGALPTIGLVIMTALAGVWLLRMEGLATINRVQEKLSKGLVPDTELLEGVMLIIGGALLLTPGFATDIIGFICLLPGLRRPLAARIIRSSSFMKFSTKNQFGSNRGFGQSPFDQDPFQSGPFNQRNGPSDQGHTIDGEFNSEDENPRKLDQ